jgi:hypothetical protein
MIPRPAFIAVLSVFLPTILVSTAGAQNPPPEGRIAISQCGKIDQPGSYRLVANLTAEGNCLVLTADGVTINLAGFAITGNGTGTAIVSRPAKATGIPQARTVVRNGDISHFALAIDLSGTVERLRITSNGRGISVGVGAVRDNVVQFNDATGIRLADGIVTGNFVVGNGTGIVVEEAGIVSGNQVAGNTIGIDVKGKGSALIGNIADGNSQIGMRIACPSNLTNNTAIGNGRNLVLIGKNCRNEGNLIGPQTSGGE